MSRLTKYLKILGIRFGSFEARTNRMRSGNALQRAVMEVLEPRQLMSSAPVNLYWVQTGTAYAESGYVQLNNIEDDRGFVVASSPIAAIEAEVAHQGGEATVADAGDVDYKYTPGEYAFPTGGSTESLFWQIGAGLDATSAASGAMVAYGGYLNGHVYETYVPTMAIGDTSYCVPCNTLINPGANVGSSAINAISQTGQPVVLNVAGQDLTNILSTVVWDTSPSQTVAQYTGLENQGISLFSPLSGVPGETFEVAYGAGYVEIFESGGSGYATQLGGSLDTLTGSPGSFVLTDADGQQFNFGGGGTNGASSITDAGGNKTQISYVSDGLADNGLPAQIKTPMGASGGMQVTTNTYSTQSGLLLKAVIQNSSDSGSHLITPAIQETDYDYYDGSELGGPANGLALETIKEGSTIINETGYRYYTGTWSNADGDRGQAGEVKYAFGIDAVNRLEAAGLNLETSTDTELAPYADIFYEYDGLGRVTKQVVQGTGCSACTSGLGTFTFSYETANPDASDYNTWTNQISETMADGSVHTVYTNMSDETILDIVKSGTQSGATSWINYYRYDADGNQILHVNPSGMVMNGTNSYDESYPDLVNYNGTASSYVSTNNGLFEWTDYATTSTATTTIVGSASDQIMDTAVSQGREGAKYYQTYTDYIESGSSGFFQVADSVQFPNNLTSSYNTTLPAATFIAASGNTTSYAYQFTGTNLIESMTTSAQSSPLPRMVRPRPM